MYDITRRESFNHIVTWLEEARQNSNNPNLAVMVVGNKADLAENREVPTETAREFAAGNKMAFIETSAKTAANIPELFETIAKKLPRPS